MHAVDTARSPTSSPLACPTDDTFARWAEGVLEGAELQEFEAHLRDCAACNATSQDLRAAPSQTQKSPTEPPPPDPTEVSPARAEPDRSRARARLVRASLAPPRASPRPRRLPFAAMAVAVMVVFALGGGALGWWLRHWH